MQKIIFSIFCFLFSLNMNSQVFSDYFEDKTLRLDLNFSGNTSSQHISLDELCSFDGWYGKRTRLDEVPIKGDGEVIVKLQGKVIYKNSFCTLFQEWLTYDEAKTVCRSFENVFLVPMPKDTVEVTVNLYNNRQQMMTTATFTVNPHDILIRRLAVDSDGELLTQPYKILQKARDPKHCINIAFVAEGYQKKEMRRYLKDARIAVDAIFSHEPFKSHREDFNVIAVKNPSEDSGTSEPGNGIWKKTSLSSHFNTFYSDRYLTTLHLKDLHNVLAGIPYEHIIVLVNTEKYGGGGILNSYNLSMTHHKFYKPVVVHEFGHSFAGLADEYYYEAEPLARYPHDIEPWEKNITTKVDFQGKWENLITPENSNAEEKVSLIEGAGYSPKGIYRACDKCRMRINDYPVFCPACQKAIADIINFYISK